MNEVEIRQTADDAKTSRPAMWRFRVAKTVSWLKCALAALGLTVAILPAHAQTVAGTIGVGLNPNAIAVNPATNTTYVANFGGTTVTVINNLTNSTATVGVGSNPNAIAINPATNEIYVTNSGGSTVSVINGATNVVTNTITVGSSPGAVAVDMATNQIYVTNRGSGTVSVIDGNGVNPVATVTVGSGPIAVAVNPITNKIYAANYSSANVTVINGANNSTQNVTAGSNPIAVGVNPVTNVVYVANASGSVSVIGSSNTVTATVSAGTSPNSIAVNPVTNKIYVANFGSGNMTTIDGASNGTSSMAAGAGPYSVAVNTATNQVYVANINSAGSNGVSVFSGASGGTATALLGQLTTGSSPAAIAVNPVTDRAYVADYGGSNVTVIDGSTYVTLPQSGGTEPDVVAVNPVTNRIYITDTGDGQHNSAVTVIDGSTGNVLASVPVGANPVSIAVNPLTNQIYVANQGSGIVAGNVTVINGANNTPTSVTVGNGPDAIDVNPATNKIYVANYVDGTVSIIDGSSNTVVGTTGVAPHPQALAVNAANNEVYVACAGGPVAIINGAGTATQVNAGNDPYAVAVNPSNHRAYVANYGGGTVTAIDGNNSYATATITVGSGPIGIAVNPETNKVYVANQQSSNVTVIDANNGNATSSVPAGTAPWSVAVNRSTNRIYVPNAGSNNITEIDGASNAPTTIPAGTQPQFAGVNPITNEIYAANVASNNVTIITEEPVQSIAINSQVSPLTNNVATSITPAFSFSTSNSFTNSAPVVNLFYQIDSQSGTWIAAQGSSGSFSTTSATLAPGFHVIYAFSTDGEASTSTSTTPGAGPLVGSISAYGFTVQPAGVTVAPTSLNFPNTAATKSSTPLTITLTNGGGQTLDFSFAYSDITEFPESASDSCTAAAGVLPVGASCTISITFAPELPTGSKNATLTITDNANGVPGSQQVVTFSGTALGDVNPNLTWATPTAIIYGAALTTTQLDATTSVNGAPVPGTLVYTPTAGTVLSAGTQTLSVTFTPTDQTTYAPATTTVQLTVSKAPLTVAAGNVTIGFNQTPVYTATDTGFVNNDTQAVVSGTPAFTINTSTSPIPVGKYTITPALGTLTATNYAFTNFTTGTLTVVAVPTVTVTSSQAGNTPFYGTTVTLTTTLTATSGTPTGTVSFYDAVTGATCTALSNSVLLGTQTLSGTTAVLNTASILAGTQTILACYGGDTNNFAASGSTTQTIAQAVPVITWPTPAPVNYGTAISSQQLDATTPVMGTFVYTPKAGTVVGAGTQTLSTTFTPQDPIDYKTETTTVQLVVNQAPANSQATVTETMPAGASPKALAVNPVTNKTYIVNNSGNSVTIFDGSSNTSATVSVGNQPDAVAVNPATNQIYVANYADGTVSIIDGTTNLVSGPITVGNNPTVMAVNSQTNKIYVVNQGSNSVTMINAASGNATTAISVGTNPYAVAVNPVTGKVYVTNQGPGGVGGNVSVIDGTSNTVTATVTDPAASGPYSVAVNPVTNEVFVTNLASKTVTVINAASGNAVTSVSVGTSPWAVDVNPVTNKAYVANYGSGTLTVIDAGHSNATSTVTVGTNPDAVAVNVVTNEVFVANLGSGNFTVIDGSSNTPNNVMAGTGPVAVGVNPVTDRVYVANNGSGNFSVVDGSTNTTATTNTGSQPLVVAVNPVTGTIYVANYNDGTVTVISGSTVTTVPVGAFPLAMAVNPVTNQIYVVFQGTSTVKGNVTVIDGATNTPTLITVGNGPNAIALNPVTNQIFVTNYVDATVSVINGANNSVVPVSVGVHPDAVAVNPVTNKIYVASIVNSTAGIVTVIDGTQNPPAPTAYANIGDYPLAIAVNPVSNKIYVANSNLDHYPTPGSLSVIDGVTNNVTAVPAGVEPFALAINTITNQIYLANKDAFSIMVVDGATNIPTTLDLTPDSYPFAIAVNPVSNKIYVADAGSIGGSYYFNVIDGFTNYITTLTGGTQPAAVAVNPVSNQVFIANQFSNNITALTEEQVQTINIATTIQPLAGNTTNVSSPTFDFAATNTFSSAPVNGLYFQVDTWEGRWTPASSLGGGNFSGSTVPLSAGYHIIYAFATDGQAGTSTITGLQSSPTMGNIAAYGFLVAASGGSGATLNPSTINFAGEPKGIPSNAQTATLSNGSNTPLTFSISFSGTNASDFTETTDTCSTLSGSLAANSSCTINTIFTPSQKAVNESATLTVTDNSNGVAGSMQTVGLSGIGTGNQKPTITWSPGPVTYGSTLSGAQLPTAAYQGTQLAGAFTYTPALSTLGAGAQTISVTFTPTDTTDYTSATQSFQITISPAPLTIKANDVTWSYGSTPAYTASYTGFVNGDTSSVLSGTPVFTITNNTNPTPVGTYTVTPAQGTLAAANYMFTDFVTGTLVVSKATPTITWGTQGALTPVTYPSALGSDLNAAATVNGVTVPGTFAYSAPSGSVTQTTVLPAGSYTMTATFTVTDTTDFSNTTATATLNVLLPTQASFAFLDTATSGNWQGKYGSDGYDIANMTPSLPSYASTFAVQNQLNYTWNPDTTDPRALQIPGGTGRIASTWYNPTTFSFTVNFTDGNAHLFALYALDFDNSGRSETIQIQNASTMQVLDSRTISSFSNGVYVVWTVSGNLIVTVTNSGGNNGAISAAFFGGSGSGAETVTVTPSNPTMTAGQQQTFGATITGTANTSQTVTWAITTVTPSTAPQGTLNASTGAYTAPASGTIAAATVTVTATDQDGVTGTTNITLNPGAVSGGNGATFLMMDTTTQGNWIGKYGSDGYDMANATPSLPGYDQNFGPSNQINYTWAPTTTDPRGLQIPGGTGNFAATWYNPANFTFNVNFTDGQAHEFSLYAVDWTSSGRAETVQIQDGVSGTVLDTRTLSNFSNGVYLVWQLSGNVKIVVTETAGTNAVISGAFFGGIASGPETVTVTPANPTMTASQQQTFNATITGTTNTSQTVTWAITGVTPSGAPQGTINASTGAYTAPTSGTIAAATVTLQATDQDGIKGTTTITLNPGAVTGGNGATFITTDTTTSGNWIGKYGADGFDLANATPSLPGYDQNFGPSNQIDYTWQPSTTDPRALQVPGGSNGNFAATWYNPTTFGFNVNFTDGQTHQFALYAVDWTSAGRAETVLIQDAVTGATLDTRSLANFSNGVYLVWNISGNVTITVTQTAGPNGVISGAFFGGSGTSGSQEAVTVTPANPTLTAGQQQTFGATISGTTNTSQMLTWAITAVTPSNAPQGTINASTGVYMAPASGTIMAATVTVQATDQDSVQGTTKISLNAGAASGGNGATFVTTDTTTSGSWIGKYGVDGYDLANATPSLPSYASTFAAQGQLNFTWEPSTTDPRALQIPGGTGNFAATWYNPTTFSFNVNFTDGQTHQFALYAVDWDNSGRSETVQIKDGVSGALLDTRTLTNFSNGAYLVWTISGNVKIVVTANSGMNAVISGAFFGGAPVQQETVTVTPANPTLTAGQPQTFGAMIAGTTNTRQTMTWAITGVTPSNAPEGTLNTSTGAYTAPNSATIVAAKVTISATDQDSVVGTTTITLNAGAASGTNGATFVKMDTATSGNWIGNYGSDGYDLADATPSLPSYASNFAVQGQLTFPWATTTTDTQALQVPGGNGNFAATWYNPTTFSMTMNFTDGLTHQFALYALDWGPEGRTETVQVQDGVSGAALDTRTLTNFSNGVYVVWNISGNVKIVVTTTAGVNGVISGAFFGGSGTGGPELVTVTPANPTMTAGQQQTFTAAITGTSNTSQTETWAITAVNPSNAPQGTINASTGAYMAPASGTIAAAAVTIQATDQDGIKGTTTITLNPGAVSGGNGATFVKMDTTTSGSWIGNYGADGYDLANATPSVPSYATFSVQDQLNYTWQPNTSDGRALQIPGGTGNFAATWYNPTTFSFNVDFTDGQTHQFALYAVDWDNTGRVETIKVEDGVSGVTLDSRTLSSFANGTYLVWNISGNVKIVVTATTGTNAVVSGVFFGGGAVQQETVTVTPANPTLTSGQQQTFAAAITGTSNTSQTETWAITAVNPSGAAQGSINASTGMYTAPSSTTITSATVTITATDQDGTKGSTNITLTAGATSGTNGATFVKLDTITDGSWIGKYGSSGYLLANSGSSLPSYDQGFGPSNGIGFTWLGSTSDPRALQVPPGGATSIAAAWYNPSSFSFNLNFSDNQVHQFALYGVDWDGGGRAETIQIQDGTTGLPLDTRTVASFVNGVYAVWNISGNVKVVVTKTAGANCVISGAFFD